ncbi:hypothetical protein PRZ48_010432 [Zasmidium cellare]|uniref:Uncharacterized protein n=1 Tax=Zasmidium cellare TaxID=395010 RepID=A0ABR0E8M2_ZASCE|nr:hypothetical protein PRZ48_010432 [Zasmidium cellare]
MELNLENRVAIVTGGASGIGEATALKLADAGARVVVADIQEGVVVEQIAASHGKDRALLVHCDVTQESQIQALVQQAVKFGGRVDILVNSAGSSFEAEYNPWPKAHEMKTVDFDRTWVLNARGVWLCCKFVLQQMMEQEPVEPNVRGERTRGWIVNMSSGAVNFNRSSP